MEVERSFSIRGGLRRGVAVTAFGLAALAAFSCDDRRYDYSDCDHVVRRCRTVCDYWCDRWGCYPMCWDQCWGDCYVDPTPPPGSPSPPVRDAGSYPITDAQAPAPPVGDGGGGVLCTSCVSNDDCQTGALCIFRGGPRPDASASDGGAPSGRGFCGAACQSGSDCPQGFTCTSIGATQQCLANNGVCE